ncbi:hypothetical protein D3C72_1989040 [compost metagenome]
MCRVCALGPGADLPHHVEAGGSIQKIVVEAGHQRRTEPERRIFEDRRTAQLLDLRSLTQQLQVQPTGPWLGVIHLPMQGIADEADERAGMPLPQGEQCFLDVQREQQGADQGCGRDADNDFARRMYYVVEDRVRSIPGWNGHDRGRIARQHKAV